LTEWKSEICHFPALQSVPSALSGATRDKQLSAAVAHGGSCAALANPGLRNQLPSGKTSTVLIGMIVTHL
jgi:hypothetical protein